MARDTPALERHITRLWPTIEERASVGEAVDALVRLPGWASVLTLIEAEVATIEEPMRDGRVLEQADYAARHGRIGGLLSAENAPGTILAFVKSEQQQQEAHNERAAEPALER